MGSVDVGCRDINKCWHGRDIDECAVYNGDCHPTNDCENALGTYHCVPCPQVD